MKPLKREEKAFSPTIVVRLENRTVGWEGYFYTLNFILKFSIFAYS
ncbi:MAG: hypothetical protein GXO98_06305 [Nitrospirae bacterium]|nr:hypothetical protein [Nitrospirota bacterium]